MSSVVGVNAASAIDWLTSAWSDIQSQSGSANTGSSVLDAAASKVSQLSDGLGISDGQALASQLASIQQNVVQQQGVLAGQAALKRIQDETAVKQAAAQSSSGIGSLVNTIA